MTTAEDQTDIRAAWLYFMEGLTQAEIARRLGTTRLRINRILVEARHNGLVGITLNSELATCVALERDLVRDFDATQERLLAGLAAMPEAKLQEPSMRDMNVGEWLSFLHFHEAYHIGQTGLLRRLAGKEGAIR